MHSTRILDIESVGHLGMGIARSQGKVVMVPFTAPGDRVEVRIHHCHQSYDEATLVHVLAPSPWREDPPCALFGTCGGCHLQHLSPAYQRNIKEDLFRKQITRSGAVPPEAIRLMLFADQPLHYRSRLEIHARQAGYVSLGFMSRGSRTVVPTAGCILALPSLQRLFGYLPSVLAKARVPSLTLADIAADDSGDETDMNLVSLEPLSAADRRRIINASAEIPFLRSLSVSSARGGPTLPLWTRGENHPGVTYSLQLPHCTESLTLSVWPGVFRQVNPAANALLVSQVMEWVAEGPASQRLLDLYAGMGNLAIPGRYRAAEVVAVEVNPQAVENGRYNAALLGGNPVRWIQSSCNKALRGFLQQRTFFDTVILDPPRRGCRDILPHVVNLKPERIIYVSCDSATLARDLHFLHTEAAYDVLETRCLDMFPQTYHLESLSLLRRR